MRFRVSAPEGLRFGRFALSPDGRSVAFTDDAGGASPGCGCTRSKPVSHDTSNAPARSPTSMFWSPDARFIGFVASGAIHRIAVDGTPPQLITPVEDYAGARWTPDGTILYGRARGGLLKVPASGGAPVAVTELDAARDETGHTNPVMLPDGRRFLYFRASRNPEQQRRVRRLARCRAGRTIDPTGVAAPDATAGVPVAGRRRASAVRS